MSVAFADPCCAVHMGIEQKLLAELHYLSASLPIIGFTRRAANNFGYFWAVDEAKIFKEGSMVVAGSNDDPSNIYSEEGSAKGTPGTDDPSEDTRLAEEKENAFYNNFLT